MKKSLESPEWLLLFSLFFFIVSLCFVAQVNHRKFLSHLVIPPDPAPISVTLSGALLKPGIYSVPAGTLLSEVLRKARPKKFAKLPEKDLSLLESIAIQIEELEEISVKITGAVVEPISLVVPVGTRICDLKSKISLHPEADKQFFKKKRQLKHQEILEIPLKMEGNAPKKFLSFKSLLPINQHLVYDPTPYFSARMPPQTFRVCGLSAVLK